MTKLAVDSQEQLDRRIEVGRACIAKAAGRAVDTDEEDYETFASDAISDILTAVLGPRGIFNRNGLLVGGPAIVEQATDLLDHSLNSWVGDAEDYIVGDDDPSPKEQIEALLNEVNVEYANAVVPGVKDDSVLEARRDTLFEVLAILNQ